MTFSEQVKLLLGQAKADGMYRHPATGAPITNQLYVGSVGPGTYVARDGDVTMVSEPAALLERLYASADVDSRRSLTPTLLRLLSRQNARVVARTLAATHHLDVLIAIWHRKSAATLGNLAGGAYHVTEELWRGLIHVLRFEPSLFSQDDLDAVESAAAVMDAEATAKIVKEMELRARSEGALPPADVSFPASNAKHVAPGTFRITTLHRVVDEVQSVLERVRYLRLAMEIRGEQNPVIDSDRQILLSRIQRMGFSDALSNVSNEIEKKAAAASTELEVKSVMDLLRTFFEEFVEEACRKVEGKVGKNAPSGPKVNHFAPYREYLAAAQFIGPEESELLQKLYNFLSNQGTHKLGSAPEQLRVAHATVIEWCMLVAGRIANFLH